jgi:hypothetical protein
MSRPQTQSIRVFILDRVAEDPRSVARQVAQAYGISRQAANRHLDALVGDGALEQTGATRAKEYHLRRTSLLNREVRVTPVLNPDRLWDDHIAPVLATDRPSIRDLCQGAFGEVIRNVIRHADAKWVTVSFELTARHIDVSVEDDGCGLFTRLAERTGASTPRESAEETLRRANTRALDSPASRLLLLGRNFESFAISSAGLALVYYGATNTWTLEDAPSPARGTRVAMRLCRTENLRGSARTGRRAESFTR